MKTNQDNIKIEKGIPMPVKYRSGLTDTFRKMSVGDSIVIARIKSGGLPQLAAYAKIKISVRKISNTQMRVWRTE